MDALGSLSRELLDREGVIPLFAGLLLSWLSLALSQFLKRKRISWQEGYNSKIALVPDLARRNPMFEPFLPTFNNVSSLIVRVRNSGRSTIVSDDYLEPLQFVFKNRFILDFRVSQPKPDNLREEIEQNAYVSRRIDDFGNPPKNKIKLPALRQTLAFSADPSQDPFTDEQKAERRQLTLPKLELKPRDEFTIAIDLREYTLTPGLERTDKEYTWKGKLRSGKLVDRRARARKITLTRTLAVLSTLLLGALLATILIPFSPPAESYCVEGEMKIVGSSAFESVAVSISRAYIQGCTGASIDVKSNGSLDGIRQVAAAGPAESSRLATLSDGQASGQAGALADRPVAILVYSLAVNKAANVSNLSLEQIRGIYQGRYINWRELGGSDLPIRIVSRDADSGSRQAFERHVLKFAENTLSSNFCVEKDRDPTARIIRCERDSTTQVLDEVDRTPGAIGYADTAQIARYGRISRARLDGLEPTVQYVPSGYPFWTIEYLYTNGVPESGSLLRSFVDYISSDAARSRIHDAGYTPCVQADGSILDLCRAPR